MELTMETAQPAASTTWKLTVLVCCSGAPRWGSAVALAGSMSARRAATYAGESSASVSCRSTRLGEGDCRAQPGETPRRVGLQARTGWRGVEGVGGGWRGLDCGQAAVRLR